MWYKVNLDRNNLGICKYISIIYDLDTSIAKYLVANFMAFHKFIKNILYVLTNAGMPFLITLKATVYEIYEAFSGGDIIALLLLGDFHSY